MNPDNTDAKQADTLIQQVKEIVVKAREQAFRQSNSILLQMYWQIGGLIVEDEQQGKAKAIYGKAVLKNLSRQLSLEFGKGFDESNLRNMRRFYGAFPIRDALRPELSWTHYRILSRIEEESDRQQYLAHSAENSWDTRTLQRNIDTRYLGRTIIVNPGDPARPQSLIKDPYIFEFLGLPAGSTVTENNLETALISHLQEFIMELGRGYAFVARQQHVATETSDFYIDLVFYNYHLKSFVLIDLKTGRLNHADIGQMDMYVRIYNDLKKENRIILPSVSFSVQKKMKPSLNIRCSQKAKDCLPVNTDYTCQPNRNLKTW